MAKAKHYNDQMTGARYAPIKLCSTLSVGKG